jgi:Domain of unknown function (DUF4062)
LAKKKFQIFISSTFSDLVDERQLALKAILDLDHIPAGMEAFPAIDMGQFEYIKKVIDECDYYLLIMGARYGSTDETGVSYTEREYDYAVAQAKTVIALIHNDIANLPFKHVEADPQRREKLDAFREKVQKGRMVRFWRNQDQLTAALMQAITKAIEIYPAVGWIRGDAAASDDVMQQYMQLRSEYDELLASHQSFIAANSAALDGLASLTDGYTIRYTYESKQGSKFKDAFKTTWFDLLKIVGPDLYSPKSPVTIGNDIQRHIRSDHQDRRYISLNEMDIDTVKIQFVALGLAQIRVAQSSTGIMAEFIQLTERGKSQLLKHMAVRSDGEN